MAWLVAAVFFVSLLSNAVGGLDKITETLDMIGFNLGKHRFSLMALVTILVPFVALFAGFRPANRVLSPSIAQSRSLDPTQRLLAQHLAPTPGLRLPSLFRSALPRLHPTHLPVFFDPVRPPW